MLKNVQITASCRPFSTKMILVFAIILFLLGYSAIWSYQKHETYLDNQQQQELNQKSILVAQQIKSKMDQYIHTLYGIRAFLAASDEISALEWQQFYQNSGIAKRQTDVSSIGHVHLVTEAEKELFLKKVRADESLPTLSFKKFAIHPETKKSTYAVITNIAPENFSNLQKTLGFDFTSEPIRNQALEKARDTNQPVLSDHLHLLGEDTGAVLLVLPVYHQQLSYQTPAERLSAFRGLATMGIRTEAFFDNIVSEFLPTIDLPEGSSLLVYDGNFASNEKLLYDSTKQQQVLGIFSQETPLQFAHVVAVADRNWVVTIKTHLNATKSASLFGILSTVLSVGFFSLLCSIILWQLLLLRTQIKS